MGLSGVSGPFRGAYNSFQFSTPSVAADVGIGTAQCNIWSWTVPTGMDIEITDFQVWQSWGTGSARVNLLAGGASVLQNGANSETALGVAPVSAMVLVAGAASTPATLSKGIFGTTATSIIAPATPSAPGNLVNRGRAYGAYVVGGATLAATVSNLPGAASGRITGTILWFPRSHPAALRSDFE